MGQKIWLPHVTNEIVKGSRNRICAYLIALEGWRRGLTLTWYSKKVKRQGVHAPGRLFSLSSTEREHYFYKSRGDLTSAQAQRITGNKDQTKEWLSKTGVPVPEGKKFTELDSDEKVIQYANELHYPVVLKPTNGYQGAGVFANLKNEDEFTKALKHLRENMNYPNIIVEKYISGTEYRIFVIGNQVVGAIEKIPPSVVGDGKRTIKQLINEKNKDKKNNPHLFRKPIKIDFEVKKCIKEAGYTVDSVLEEGKQIQLRKMNSLSSGGDPVDATDKISEHTKKVSVDALNGIPDLAQGGIDVIVDNKTGQAHIIEINAIAMIGSHLFPEIGQARDVPSAIIDYYFPETKGKKNFNSNIHFDLQSVLKPLIDKTASEVVVTPAPTEETHAVKYTLTGDFQIGKYLRWVRKRAIETDLYGFAKNTKDGRIIIVLAGNKEKVENFKSICEQGIKGTKIKSITEEIWSKPIKIEFTIQERKLANEKIVKKGPAAPKKKLTLLGRIKAKLKRIVKRILK